MTNPSEVPLGGQNEIRTDQLYYLSRINEVSDEDILALRNKILPEMIDNFEKNIPSDDKIILALLFKLTEEELKDLIILQKKSRYLVGMHKLGSKLLVLSHLTGNNAYYKLYKETKIE